MKTRICIEKKQIFQNNKVRKTKWKIRMVSISSDFDRFNLRWRWREVPCDDLSYLLCIVCWVWHSSQLLSWILGVVQRRNARKLKSFRRDLERNHHFHTNCFVCHLLGDIVKSRNCFWIFQDAIGVWFEWKFWSFVLNIVRVCESLEVS